MDSVTEHRPIVDTHRHPIGPKLAAKMAEAGLYDPTPTSPARDTCHYPAGIIGMPGWLQLEQMIGFDWNRWLQSSDCTDLMSERSRY